MPFVIARALFQLDCARCADRESVAPGWSGASMVCLSGNSMAMAEWRIAMNSEYHTLRVYVVAPQFRELRSFVEPVKSLPLS